MAHAYDSIVALLNSKLIYYCVKESIRVVSIDVYWKYIRKSFPVVYAKIEGIPVCPGCYRKLVLKSEIFDGDESGVVVLTSHKTIDMTEFETYDDFTKSLDNDRKYNFNRHFSRNCVACGKWKLTFRTTSGCDKCRARLNLLDSKENFELMDKLKNHKIKTDAYELENCRLERVRSKRSNDSGKQNSPLKLSKFR